MFSKAFQKIIQNTPHHQCIQSSKSLNHQMKFYFRSSTPLLSKKSFYETLGVSRSATQYEIKSAYYVLAQKYHPDKNKTPEAKQRFVEISTAYETLGDDTKRRIYDNTGMGSDEQGQDPFGGFRDGSNFWGGKGRPGQNYDTGFEDANRERVKREKRAGPTKGSDIFLAIDLTFQESVAGCKKEIKVEKRGVCKICQGSRCRPGTAPSKCFTCGGRGTINFRQGAMTSSTTCTNCKGSGASIKHPCPECVGTGIQSQSFAEEITIPKGINNGQSIRMSGKGNVGENGGPTGDIIIKVNVLSDTYFRRDGFDVYTNHFLNISEAALGGNIVVKTLYGDVEMKLEKGTQDGNKKKLNNFGITKLAPNQHQKGNHYVIFRVVVPSNPTPEQEILFSELKKLDADMDQSGSRKAYGQQFYSSDSKESSSNSQQSENAFDRFKNLWRR